MKCWIAFFPSFAPTETNLLRLVLIIKFYMMIIKEVNMKSKPNITKEDVTTVRVLSLYGMENHSRRSPSNSSSSAWRWWLAGRLVRRRHLRGEQHLNAGRRAFEHHVFAVRRSRRRFVWWRSLPGRKQPGRSLRSLVLRQPRRDADPPVTLWLTGAVQPPPFLLKTDRGLPCADL